MKRIIIPALIPALQLRTTEYHRVSVQLIQNFKWIFYGVQLLKLQGVPEMIIILIRKHEVENQYYLIIQIILG